MQINSNRKSSHDEGSECLKKAWEIFCDNGGKESPAYSKIEEILNKEGAIHAADNIHAMIDEYMQEYKDSMAAYRSHMERYNIITQTNVLSNKIESPINYSIEQSLNYCKKRPKAAKHKIIAAKHKIIDAKYEFGQCCKKFNRDIFVYDEQSNDANNIAELMIALADIHPHYSVYLPFIGSGEMTTYLPADVVASGSECDEKTWAMLQMRLGINGAKNPDQFVMQDSVAEMSAKLSQLQSSQFDGYDRIVMTPPIKHHIQAITDGIALLKEDGKMVVALPNEVMSQKSTRELFGRLVKHKYIQASINIPTPTEYLHIKGLTILLISRKPNDRVRFYNLTEKNGLSLPQMRLSNDKIRDLAYTCLFADPQQDDNAVEIKAGKIVQGNMLPTYYIEGKEFYDETYRMVPISDFTELVGEPADGLSSQYPILKTSDLGHEWFDCTINSDDITELCGVRAAKARKSKTRVFSNMILVHEEVCLFALKGDTPVVGKLVIGDKNKEILLDSNILAFKITDGTLSQEYLFKNLLENRYTSSIDEISDPDNAALFDHALQSWYRTAKIPMQFNKELQLQELLAAAVDKLKSAKKDKEQAMQKQIEDIRLRKHTLSSIFGGFKNRWKKLRLCMEENDGVLKNEFMATRTFDYNVKEWMDLMDKTIDTIGKDISSITMVKENFDPAKLYHPDVLIKEYCKSNPNGLFNYDYGEPVDKGERILISHDAMFRVLENIVNNAKTHGFTHHNRQDYKIKFQTTLTEDQVIITIANNGAPLPKSLEEKDVFAMGVSSSFREGEHEGMGCYDVRNILSLYDASCELLSKEEGNFKVMYRLYFNRQKK